MSAPSRRRRTRWWWLLLAGAASVVAVLLGSVAWYQAGTVTLSGRQVTDDLVPVLGYASSALVLLALTLKGRAHRLAAIALFALGVGEVVTGWTRHRPAPERLNAWGASGTGAATLAWVWLAVAGIVTCAAGVGLATSAPGSGQRTDRFDRRPRVPADPSLAAWRAMDAGLDPTADPPGAHPTRSERGNLSRSTPSFDGDGVDHDETAHDETDHNSANQDSAKGS